MVERHGANRRQNAHRLEGRAKMDGDWLAALSQLRQAVGERNYVTWIEPMRWSRRGNEIRAEAPGRLHYEWVARHYLTIIQAVFRELVAPEAKLRLILGVGRADHVAEKGNSDTQSPKADHQVEKPEMRRTRNPAGLRVGRLVDGYDFASFVVGPANELAVAAGQSVAKEPGSRFNPFFVWGGVGLGKTHLVNAIGHEVRRRSGGRRVGCLSAETFMNLMIQALRTDKMNEFRARFRELDILILDDVQFLSGKERTQEEFFHTFEALSAGGGQIVLTSDKPPHCIAGLEQRLRSRFEGGLTVDMKPPTIEMRAEILRRKAARRGHHLPDEVIAAIAVRCGPSVREVEGGLNRALAFVEIMQRPATADLVARLLGPEMPPVAQRPISITEIQTTVAQYFKVPLNELIGHARDRSTSTARQVAMYLCRSVAQASLHNIAAEFGGRDHTSVLYAIRMVERRCQSEPEVVRTLREIEAELRCKAQEGEVWTRTELPGSP